MIASQQRKQAKDTEAAVRRGDRDGNRQPWLRHPEFWIAVALGAALRLWALNSTHFLFDQATLMTLARDAVVGHMLPVAGLSSSIHTLNPPISVYVLLPFAAFGTNPFPAVAALALWNVAGVALCYVFALRYFGRRIAAVGALLFAVGPAAVEYSRFLWPQNSLPPLLVLFALAIYAMCVRGRRGMLAPAVLLLALGALMHPAALLLAPALVAAVLLAPHRPRGREYALSAAIVVALLLPTIVWELVSGWSDLRLAATYSAGPAKIDPEVFFRLYEALGTPGLPQSGTVPHAPPHSLAGVIQLLAAPVTDPSLGAASPSAALAPLYIALGLAALLLFAVGWLALTAHIVAPARALWRDLAGTDGPAGWKAQLRAWADAAWRWMRADAGWRAYLLLWLLVTSPLVLLIRHSSPIFTHYLIALYPFAFLTMAFGVVTLAQAAAQLVGSLRVRAPGPGPVASALVLALVAALALGQTAQSLLYSVSIATGQYDARVSGYGYPLGALQHADAQINVLQRQSGARQVFIIEDQDESVAMDYTLVREHPDRVGFVDDCLVLPPADAGPALVIAASGSPVGQALASLPDAAMLARIPMAGSSPLAVYRVTDTSRTTYPGETPLPPVRFQDASGAGLQLEGGQLDGGQVRLRWTALSPTPRDAAPLTLRAQVRYVSSSGKVSQVWAFRDCAPTRWQAGDTVLTWLPRPSSWNAAAAAQDAMLIQGERYTTTYAMPTFGPLRLLTSQQVNVSWGALVPQPPADQSLGGLRLAYGGVVMSLGNFNSPAHEHILGYPVHDENHSALYDAGDRSRRHAVGWKAGGGNARGTGDAGDGAAAGGGGLRLGTADRRLVYGAGCRARQRDACGTVAGDGLVAARGDGGAGGRQRQVAGGARGAARLPADPDRRSAQDVAARPRLPRGDRRGASAGTGGQQRAIAPRLPPHAPWRRYAN